MNNSHIINSKCNDCGESRGVFEGVRVFCRCEPDGWEVCTRHASHVRRKFQTSRVDDNGNLRYFGVYAMMAPCRGDTCFKPDTGMYEKIAENEADTFDDTSEDEEPEIFECDKCGREPGFVRSSIDKNSL